MMPDPRGNAQQSTQFPPPGFGPGAPAQVLDPSAPGYAEQPRPTQYAEAQQAYNTAVPPGHEVEEYGDYFGVDIRHKYMLPDGKQWIEFKVMTEGDLARYQAELKRDVVVEKATGDARIKIDQVEERHALLRTAVTNWFMMRKLPSGEFRQVTFSHGKGGEFHKWMLGTNPQIVADLADAVRRENPFLLGTGPDTIEAIDKQIADLYEQREKIVQRDQGNVVSANS
jgi:hypothetical protein